VKTHTSMLIVCATLMTSSLVTAQPSPAPGARAASPATPVTNDAEPPLASPPAPAAIPPANADRPATGASSPSQDRRGPHGFLVRLQLGGGYRSASSGVGSTALDVSGSGFGFSVLAGGAVFENVFLYGEVLADYTSNPTIEVGQKKVVAQNASTRLVGFGPGITYLMPAGLHLGGTLLLTRLTVEKDEQELGATNTGYGFAARVGKDFWLTDRHALGIVGQFSFASMPDKSTSAADAPTVSATGFTLALSGTYN
jgi:hypothetical protein